MRSIAQWIKHAKAVNDALDGDSTAFRQALENALPTWFWQALDAARRRVATQQDIDALVVFLEADPLFHRSGYAKADTCRFLERNELDSNVRARLEAVILRAVTSGDRREFRDFAMLARAIASPQLRDQLTLLLESQDAAIVRRAEWVLSALEGKSSRRKAKWWRNF